MFAEVSLVTSSKSGVVAVPSDAVGEEEGRGLCRSADRGK